MQNKLYHIGIISKISRSTFANADQDRDSRIYADFAHILIDQAKELYRDYKFFKELNETVYAFDSTTIDLYLSWFTWEKFKKTKSTIGAFYIVDKGYIDFERLYNLNNNSAYFVTRAKSNFKFKIIYSHQVDKSSVLICDKSIILKSFYPSKDYPDKIRRIKYFDS